MKIYMKLLRVKHWLKNFLIFFPLLFSGKFFTENMILTFFAFLAFSFAASTVYIINDIKDKEKDKKHDIKKNRPIASGNVSIKQAVIIAILLFALSFFINVFTIPNRISFIWIIIYLIINILYSFGLKNVPLLDVFLLVLGFLIRVLYGASVINIDVSTWLYLTVLSVSFYLSLGKRRNEIIKNGTKSRDVLKFYSKEYLDKNMYMCLALAIVFYSLWCGDISSSYKYIMFSVPLVIIICMKYNMILEGNSYGDPVEVVLSDKTLILLILLYAIFIFLCLYFPVLR